jgi:hypothetical protein
MADIVQLNQPKPVRLKCPGVGRDKDHDRALAFYFNRPVTDDEMRYLHEVMQRAAACIPEEIGAAQ